MIGKTTLPQMWWPLMGRPSVKLPYCPICGRAWPLEQHHPVRRGAGKLFDANGREVRKPTITLCGFGNNRLDADGAPYCHGLAHEGRLHFRWSEVRGLDTSLAHFPAPYEGGHWEYLLLDEGCDYLTALGMDGWRRLRRRRVLRNHAEPINRLRGRRARGAPRPRGAGGRWEAHR